MARQILLGMLALLILCSAAEARRKKSRAGSITDRIYTDAIYGFQIGVLNGWDAEAGKKSATLRLTITDELLEKSQREQQNLQKNKIVFGVPGAAVFVFETSLSPAALLDSVLSIDGKSDQRKDILNEAKPAGNYECVDSVTTILKKDTEVNGHPGVHWVGSFGFHPCQFNPGETEELMRKVGRMIGFTHVPRFYGTILVFVQLDEKNVFVLSAHSAMQLLKPTRSRMAEVLKTIKWNTQGD